MVQGSSYFFKIIYWIVAFVNLVIIRKVWLPCSTACSCCLRTWGYIEAWNSEAFLTMFWWNLARYSFQMWWLWCIWSGIELDSYLVSFYICKKHLLLQALMVIILPQFSTLSVALWHFLLCALFKTWLYRWELRSMFTAFFFCFLISKNIILKKA